LLADVGDIHRFVTRDRFASWNGTAPLDASSGQQQRHRLSRAGNRRINRTLHIMAIPRQPVSGSQLWIRSRIVVTHPSNPNSTARPREWPLEESVWRPFRRKLQSARTAPGEGG
jgi:transposase